MNTELTFNPAHTAVLAMDCQVGIVSMLTGSQDEFLARAAAALNAARCAAMTVIHVQVAFRPGLPEVSGRNKLFGPIKDSLEHAKLFQDKAGAIHPALGPQPGDIVVTKRRVSAFAGSDLAMLLRAEEIETIVLFGIATSGVVLSTLLEASDLDYKIAVLADCCADRDPELHTALIDRLFARRADILTSEAFCSTCDASTVRT